MGSGSDLVDLGLLNAFELGSIIRHSHGDTVLAQKAQEWDPRRCELLLTQRVGSSVWRV